MDLVVVTIVRLVITHHMDTPIPPEVVGDSITLVEGMYPVLEVMIGGTELHLRTQLNTILYL